ncbi:hypothetical protein E2A64_17035 [Pseudohoeflea suaedae]|uniref:Uncharacterized protein n=1 Tax=Pseudohoeflea suaedae TaxID=877384 RepID=A0A4R5PHR3_9HYPH|nr:hypothetical protein [Pseudohoeflea suaedae]TDH34372.1 hypothetical protein E2A64_17035 [Pseudohoeflea suaedae]
METELATWHFVAAAAGSALLGILFHVCRAVFNVFPDKLSDTPAVNIFVSNGYSWADHVFGTEYDDAGYYRLDSLKNLRLAVGYSLFCGMAVMLFLPDVALGIAALLDLGLQSFVDLVIYRMQNFRLATMA